MAMFWHYELRTTEAHAARDFYRRVLGHERAVVWPLHEEALARGAKPHWLGNVEVEDQERAVRRFLERGSTALGPTRSREDGSRISVLRDPGGAILALTSAPKSSPEPVVRVAFHALSTPQLERAEALYSEVLGWALEPSMESGPLGAFRGFAWQTGGPRAGALSAIEGRPGVHPHWLFFFEVPSLEVSVSSVRAAGGRHLEPFELTSGERGCVCEDAQGAAFGLWQA